MSDEKPNAMDRQLKLELIQRTLGIRHKLKVHDSMKAPETHEDMAVSLLAKWELEDELVAIEQILADARNGNVSVKRQKIMKENGLVSTAGAGRAKK